MGKITDAELSPLDIHMLQQEKQRTIQPITRKVNSHLPLIAVNQDGVLIEKTGEVLSLDDFSKRFTDLRRSVIVTYSPEVVLLGLHRTFSTNPRWRWNVTVKQEGPRGTRETKKVTYCGFKRANGHHSGALHVVLDANSFYGTADFPTRQHTLRSLLELGQQVREFCVNYNLEIRPSQSGLAAQLLRHPMFYPESRAQVPHWINEKAREHLPGNHYEVFDTGRRFDEAIYIDQRNAHHYAASNTALPDANSIQAWGSYRNGGKWARKRDNPDSLYQRAMGIHGLFHVVATVPPLDKDRFRFSPPYMREPGERDIWLWSNEVSFAESLGLDIHYLIEAYGSTDIDSGITAYAKWAMDIQSEYPWSKRMLLTTYGLLAARDVDFEQHLNDNESYDALILANYPVSTKSYKRSYSPKCNNVLQRGLIESQVRALSLDIARKCHSKNCEVISIYADGVFLRIPPGSQLPLELENPWRVKEKVTELEFECSTRFKSKEMSRFPGTPRFRREYLHTIGGK